MALCSDILQDAAEKMGVYASTELLSNNSSDQTRMFNVLNNMLDSWSNESLTCFEELEQSGVLVVGQSQYTIGSGGNFNVTRPLRIKDGPGAAYILDPNGNKYGVTVRPRDSWNLISNPTEVTANVPTDIFYDPQYPLAVMNVFPIPNISWTLFWDSYLPFTVFASVGTAVSLPPGYVKAMVDNLAVEAWPYFKPDGPPPPQLLMRQAMISKGNVKRTNRRDNVAVYDREIVAGGAYGTYNIYSDRQ